MSCGLMRFRASTSASPGLPNETSRPAPQSCKTSFRTSQTLLNTLSLLLDYIDANVFGSFGYTLPNYPYCFASWIGENDYLFSVSYNCRYEPSRNAHEPHQVEKAVPHCWTLTLPPVSRMMPKIAQSQKPPYKPTISHKSCFASSIRSQPPMKFQKPICQPRVNTSGLYHLFEHSSMNSAPDITKQGAPMT